MPRNNICATNDSTSPCEGSASCDGSSIDCPLPKALNNKSCGDHGTCRDRKCQAFCEIQGQLPCQCDEGAITDRFALQSLLSLHPLFFFAVKDSCFVCCRHNSSDACKPVKEKLILKDGRPCVQGICKKGKCHRLIRNQIERLWIIIKYFNVNEIGEQKEVGGIERGAGKDERRKKMIICNFGSSCIFSNIWYFQSSKLPSRAVNNFFILTGRIMWANVVGTVIILSLIVWIPLSCFISYYVSVTSCYLSIYSFSISCKALHCAFKMQNIDVTSVPFLCWSGESPSSQFVFVMQHKCELHVFFLIYLPFMSP